MRLPRWGRTRRHAAEWGVSTLDAWALEEAAAAAARLLEARGHRMLRVVFDGEPGLSVTFRLDDEERDT